ncbi:uncharacterized protein DEA37_0001379 [Paragonimus westermani]|uniref:OBG-type G domain-containing protein n=1 Tax=Paragonimus westermani TaxID=34504 RepID=A0A5J4NGA6_9TREM|nr:uncharacterized protein DEA37_0001379 [Paragonimus westermani]
MGILDKIAEIENEISRTQKNKATEYHLGLLKAKLAKYRGQLLEAQEKSSGKVEGFDVMKSGDARVALIGFPSVGKYNGAKIQLLDLPGIIEGASQGKGRGRQVIAVARTADLVIIMLDATKPDVHRRVFWESLSWFNFLRVSRSLLEKELEAVGIRLNKRRPNIYFKLKKTGGLKITSMVPLTRISEKMIQMILQEYKIFNAEIILREDSSPDEFIDVVVGNRVYLGCLYVYNKIDQISLQEVDRLAREPHSVVVSCNLKLNLNYLLEKLWEHLDLIQVYTKKRGERPDLEQGLILRNGCTVEHVVSYIQLPISPTSAFYIIPVSHGSSNLGFPIQMRPGLALCRLFCPHGNYIPYDTDSPPNHFMKTKHDTSAPTESVELDGQGTSVKFSPQHVGLNHTMHQHDVIQIIKK